MTVLVRCYGNFSRSATDYYPNIFGNFTFANNRSCAYHAEDNWHWWWSKYPTCFAWNPFYRCWCIKISLKVSLESDSEKLWCLQMNLNWEFKIKFKTAVNGLLLRIGMSTDSTNCYKRHPSMVFEGFWFICVKRGTSHNTKVRQY